MSTRYVWVKSEVVHSTNSVFADEYDYYDGLGDNVAGYTATRIEITEDGKVNLAGNIYVLNSSGGTTQRQRQANPNIYFAVRQTGNTEYVENMSVNNDVYWTASPSSFPGKVILAYLNPNTTDWPKVGYMWKKTVVSQSGNYIALVSSGKDSAFPSDDQSGGFWYTIMGSDIIDPLSISYSVDKPERGEAVTVTVVPRANTLGGTVFYLYQYSIDGGKSWVSAGNETTATEKAITVPSNAEQFMARVRASDDLGFTSTDYVTGNNLDVQTMRLWAGVDNKARRGKKLSVGVDNKARRVVKAWVGVDGKARRWF